MTTPKPALPEPVAYADAANLRAAPAVDDMPIIAWPCGGELNGRFFYEPLYTADQLRAYGDARAAEARATQEPREAFAKLQAEVEALRKALKPFADADLTSPVVRDTFGFDVLRARAALQEQKS